MRILILSDRIPPEHVGGAEKVAWGLATAHHQAGHEVHVIAATAGASFREIREGIPTYHLHSRYPERFRSWMSLYNPQVIPAFSRLLDEIKPDVVHAHNIHADLSYASLRATNQAGLPVVFTAHDLMPVVYGKMRHFVDTATCTVDRAHYKLPRLYNLKVNRFRYNPLRNVTIRHFLNRYTHIRTAVSGPQKAALEANGLPLFEVVHNGIETAPFRDMLPEHVEHLRSRFYLLGKKVILFGGRLSPGKGSRQLLETLDRVILEIPEVRLLVLSTRSLDSSALHGLSNLKPEHVVEGGWLDGHQLRAAYALSDIITVPSIYLDPFPTINLEGMAAGKPVVATCFGGSSDIVVNGETGYIINPFNTAEFAERLVDLLLDEPLRQQMGAAGYQRLRQSFTLTQQQSVMLEHYKRALQL
jgi:glycosyltransferase involved in cell wall biosynthesis